MKRRQSAPITEGYQATDKDVEQLRTLVSQAFQESQRTIAGHRKLIVSLTNIQERAVTADLETEFNKTFCKCLNRVLPVKRTEKAADRVVKLVEGFSRFIQEKCKLTMARKQGDVHHVHQLTTIDAPENDEEDVDTVASRFTDEIIRHLLRGVTAKDKLVRSRSCQLIAAIVNGLQEIDDDLYDVLKFHLCKRLYDKEQSVRLNSALALTRLQDDPQNVTDGTFSITKMLLSLLQHDPSPEVRRAILFNLEKNTHNLPYLLERASDVHPINRRSVYSRTIKEIGDFRLLSIGMREKLLHWGLKDRDQNVRKAASKMFLGLWLHNANDDLLELLERLDVLNSKIAGTAMDVFFSNRRDALDKMEFSDEFWRNLTPESIFLVRKFNDFCVKEKLSELVEERMPELTKIGFIIEHYLGQLQEDPSDPEMEFIVEQLLVIAETYDFGDEIGRRKMLSLLRDAVLNNEINDTLIKCSVAIIRKLSVKESDFSQVIVELVSDIKDKVEENKTESDSEAELAEKEMLASIRCLSIAQSTLELIEKPIEENVYLSSLLDTLVISAVRNHESRIRERGLFCLGLCCLLSKQLAIENILLFGHCFSRGDSSLKILAIRTISDILTIHGTSVLDVEDGVDTMSIYKMYYRAVRNDDDTETQTVAAISLCKLLLAGVIKEPDLIKTLIVVYFNGSSAHNQPMRQALSYCIPVYCFSSAENQALMSSVVVDSVRRLAQIHDTVEGDMLTPTQILQQLIDWTNPNRVVQVNNRGEAVSGGGKDDLHCDLAIEIMERLLDEDNEPAKDERKALVTSLSKLYLPPTVSFDKISELNTLVEQYVEDGAMTEAFVKNAITKFSGEVTNLVKKAEAMAEANTIKVGEKQEEEEEDEIEAEQEVEARVEEDAGMGVSQESIKVPKLEEDAEEEIDAEELVEQPLSAKKKTPAAQTKAKVVEEEEEEGDDLVAFDDDDDDDAASSEDEDEMED